MFVWFYQRDDLVLTLMTLADLDRRFASYMCNQEVHCQIFTVGVMVDHGSYGSWLSFRVLVEVVLWVIGQIYQKYSTNLIFTIKLVLSTS